MRWWKLYLGTSFASLHHSSSEIFQMYTGNDVLMDFTRLLHFTVIEPWKLFLPLANFVKCNLQKSKWDCMSTSWNACATVEFPTKHDGFPTLHFYNMDTMRVQQVLWSTSGQALLATHNIKQFRNGWSAFSMNFQYSMFSLLLWFKIRDPTGCYELKQVVYVSIW